jgi:hypothetical protein
VGRSTNGYVFRLANEYYIQPANMRLQMETMTPEVSETPDRVYVILRVYDLMTPEIGMKIFVDPLRFKGSKLDFEADQWFVTTS